MTLLDRALSRSVDPPETLVGCTGACDCPAVDHIDGCFAPDDGGYDSIIEWHDRPTFVPVLASDADPLPLTWFGVR